MKISNILKLADKFEDICLNIFKSAYIEKLSEDNNSIDLTDIDDFTFSAVMRKLRSNCSKEQVREFLKIFKHQFDKLIKSKDKNPELNSLKQTLIIFNKSNPIKINKKLIKSASISRFRKIDNDIYRGSAPDIDDVKYLHDNLHIKKIVSLDMASGERIDRTCKLLNIEQVKIYIDGTRKSLLNLLNYDLKDLLGNGPTFVHCAAGKDRTGLVAALYECKYLNKDPKKALEDAKDLGFGVGVDPKYIDPFEKLILSCKPKSDNNSADIVSNEREYSGDNRDSMLDEAHQGSFAPYMDVTRQYPYDSVYSELDDQSPTRQNYNRPIKQYKKDDQVPVVGLYNNDAGVQGTGFVISPGGFIND